MIVIDNKKLEKINKSCIDIAKRELVTLKQENDSFSNEKINQMLERYKQELSDKYFVELNKVVREYNRKIFDFEQQQQMRINKLKKSLKEDLIIELTKEIEKFVDSCEYEQYLINNINKTLEKNKDKSGSVIYITERDYKKYFENLSLKFNLKIEKIDNNNLGGCILVNQIAKVSLDNTLKNSIEEYVKDIK